MSTELKSSSWKTYLIALIVGAIYPLGFAPIERWPLAILSVSAFWWFLKDTDPKVAFRTGFSYGLGLFAVGVSWVYVSINTFGNASAPLAVFLTFLFVCLLAILFGLLAWFFRKYFKNYSLLSQIIAFSLMWLGINFFQGYSFISFPWLYLGYSQAESVFMGIASIFGVHGVTLYLLPLAILTAEVATNKTNLKIFALGAYLISGFGLSWVGLNGQIKEQGSLTVALVQPNINQHEKWNPDNYVPIVRDQILQTQAYWGADLIVWPEASIPRMDAYAQPVLEMLSTEARNANTTFLTGILLLPDPKKPQEYYAGMKQLGKKTSDYRKQQLVPFGEYVPFQSIIRGLIDFFDMPMSSFTPGNSAQAGFSDERAYYIPAICYEIAFPELIQGLSSKSGSDKPQAIVTISNDTWFGESWGPLQHFQMAKMRAIENGLPVIRATNNGVTALIDHYGRVLDQESRFEKAVLAGVVPLTQRSTIFNQYGHWPLWVLCVLLTFSALVFRKSH